MSTWKLPRKAKKAFVRKYGRAAYRVIRLMDTTGREGPMQPIRRNEVWSIAADFGGTHPVAVIGKQRGDVFHVLGTVSLRGASRKSSVPYSEQIKMLPSTGDYYKSALDSATRAKWNAILAV